MYKLYKVFKWQGEVKAAQSCPTLCNPMDCTVHGILQVPVLEWVVIPFSRGSSQPREGTQVSFIAGEFFTSWATREAYGKNDWLIIKHCVLGMGLQSRNQNKTLYLFLNIQFSSESEGLNKGTLIII